jgi:hypothetical protein
MSLERLVGTHKFPTTLVTLSLQLWNQVVICISELEGSDLCYMKGFCGLIFKVSTKALVNMGYLILLPGQIGLQLSVP